MKEITATEAGLSQDELIKIVLTAIVESSGCSTIQNIYNKVNDSIALKSATLSEQGRHSLRRLVNTTAVKAGYIEQYDPENPGWRITQEGREFLTEYSSREDEIVFNTDTQTDEPVTTNITLSSAFEHYCIDLLRRCYPYYTWFHQGRFKKNERGLDIIGEKIGEANNEPKTIGVQVKLHQENSLPTEKEWLKFLAGCFTRKIHKAIFITTGKLNGEQRREAGEGLTIVIEGKDEINRLSDLYQMPRFEFLQDP